MISRTTTMCFKWVALACATVLAGCGSVPSQGPSALAVAAPSPELDAPKPYVVVNLSPQVANVAGQYEEPSFSSFFEVSSARPAIDIAVGDQLTINIFEAGADGLFSSTTAKATAITSVVDRDGQIFVPYVGTIRASGRSPAALRALIEAALEDKAIQPQVQVLVGESIANSVTVLGAVGTPGPVPVPVPGASVLDVIAAAGGSRGETFRTRIILRRGSRVASANLEDLFDRPRDNVPVRPGDTLLVTEVAETYTVFGAATNRAEVPFESRRVTLAEGLARAGGVDQALADARGVFLFRFEPAHIAKALSERAVVADDVSRVPVVYRMNLKDPNTFFLMQTFNLRDEDLVYIATHPSVEFNKFLNIIQPLIQQAITGLTLTQRFSR